jgi:hypothetical protein
MKNNPHYAPENLLNILVRVLQVENDRQLAARLCVLPSQICKIRKRLAPISAAFLINMHEETGLSLLVLRALMGDFREDTGPSAKHPAAPPPQRLQELQRLYDMHRPPHIARTMKRSYTRLGHASVAS